MHYYQKVMDLVDSNFDGGKKKAFIDKAEALSTAAAPLPTATDPST